LQDIVRILKAKGADLKATKQPISGLNGRGISTARGSTCTLVLYGRSPRDWEKTAM
jgi:hypothetical protein